MFSKWIIFIVLFAFSENAPVTKPPEDLDLTDPLNKFIFDIIRPSGWSSVYDLVYNGAADKLISNVNSYNVRLQNGTPFHNITMKFRSSLSLKVGITFKEDITVIFEMASTYLIGYPNNTNNYIETEPIPLNFTVHVPMPQPNLGSQKPVTTNFHNFDQYDIKLQTNGYAFKPDEENQIKQDLKTYVKTTLNEKVNQQEWKTTVYYVFAYMFVGVLGQNTLEMQDKNLYYFIGTIPSADYTLSNVTIKGLWNFRSIFLDFSNPAIFPVLQISDVSGTMIQSFPSGDEKSVQLSFKADDIYILTNRTARRVDIRIKGYSVKNTNTCTLLSYDQSKLIIEKIESAIAGMIKTPMKGLVFL